MKLWIAGLALVLAAPVFAQQKKDDPLVARGRYLFATSGCNDCHTPGYPATGGKVPEAQWLTGDELGWRGPWGTTYATNLRIYFSQLSEAEWMKKARALQARPPMPWFILRDMTDRDLRALYRYARRAGSAGKPAPAYVPPDRTPSGPFVQFPEPPPAAKK